MSNAEILTMTLIPLVIGIILSLYSGVIGFHRSTARAMLDGLIKTIAGILGKLLIIGSIILFIVLMGTK